MSGLFAILRQSLRSLARTPSYAIAAILTLALGMGASASIYTLLQRVVLDPLPFPNADRLVRLKNPVPGVGKSNEWNMSTAQYFYYGAHVPAFAEVGAYQSGGTTIATSGDPERARATRATSSTLRMIGARPARGRILAAHDDSVASPPVVVLGYGFWRAKFGADETIIGKTIRLNDNPYEVVGVMSPGVEVPPDRGEAMPPATDVWMSMRIDPAGPFYNNHVLPMIARLRDDATVEGAQAQVSKLVPQLATEYPVAYSTAFFERYGFTTVLYPLKTYVIGDAARNLWILFGAVALLLAIACANVGNLFLARLETRKREFAVRTALGAGRAALARSAFGEGLVLAGLGGLLAIVISIASAKWITMLAPPGLPRLDNVSVDWRVLAFTGFVALTIAVVIAIVPALQFNSAAGVSVLGEGGRSTTIGVQGRRLRGGLVVTQVALALMLIVGSGLLLQSYRKLRAVNPGIDPGGVLTFELYLPSQRYDSLTKVWRFQDAMLAKIRALPGVSHAGASVELPFLTGFGCTVQGFEDQAVMQRLKDQNQTTCAGQAPTTPGYFETLGMKIVAGRSFSADDNETPEKGSVIVTKAFADRFWPKQNAIGQGVAPNGRTKPPYYHVIGVVDDVHGTALDGPPAIGIFYPIVAIPGTGRWYPSAFNVVVKVSKGDPLALVNGIRHAVSEIDPTVPIANVETMEHLVDRSMGRLAFTMMLLGIAGSVALALAAIGLYGLISYIVTRRTNEIGVRMALGAQQQQVVGLVVRGAMSLAATGIVLGVAGAAASARVLGTLLYGVAPWDPVSYLGAVAVLASVAGVAGWIPSRRAARIDPAVALRAD